MSWSQNYPTFTSGQKKCQQLNNHDNQTLTNTIIKNDNRINNQLNYDQIRTPVANQYHPKKALVFLGNNRSKHLFPLYRDEQIGINGEHQRIVHHSLHDDDKMTTTTQLGLAISQTCEDLYEILNKEQRSYHGSFTQQATDSRKS